MKVQLSGTSGSIWRLWLEPDSRGRMGIDRQGLRMLEACLDRVAAAARCRVLVMASRGAVFCSGMDLEEAVELGAEECRRATASYARCLRKLAELDPVVIAVVEGAVTGGGLGLIGVADGCLASTDARFTLPECTLGLRPALVLPALLRRMPRQKAMWLALSASSASAEQAQRWGLVDLVAAGSGLDALLRRTLRGLLRTDPAACASWKRRVDAAGDPALERALDQGAAETARDLQDPARRQALRDLLDGEAPPWFERLPAEVGA